MEQPRVAVVTEAVGGFTDSLSRTARSLGAQTFQNWSWTIVAARALAVPFDDPRIRTLLLSSRPETFAGPWRMPSSSR